ncbi:unnamed protein product [Gordionus sp. m RMFG-2023]|uniref:long-chain-fatty-acid--CoA ligase ACSBG2-like n=1 Tax=Gordionus sp. m RMFG-2023 TaxID=3053472 RepID=UPI0030DE59AD
MSDSDDSSYHIPNGIANKQTVEYNLAEATNYICHDPEKAVLLRLEPSGPGSIEPVTVPDRFLKVVSSYPDFVALKYQVYDDSCEPIDQPWISVTYKEYYEMARRTARAFIAIGLEPKHGVGIMGFNSPEWFYSNFGAIFAGGLSTGIYTTNNAETCYNILNDSCSNLVVVEDSTQLAKILKIRDRLPMLKAAIQYRGKPQTNVTGDGFKIYSWKDFIQLSDHVTDKELEARLSTLRANMCCSLIFTSGTTGNPKGVMISHDNLTWTSRQVAVMIKVRDHKEVLLTYLPLSHVAAQIVDMYLVMDTANTIYFAHPDVLKGTLALYLRQIRPTIFIGVPRVWEKITEKMQEMGGQATGIKKKIAAWAKEVGSEGTESLMRGKPVPWTWGLANFLVFKKVKKALGLDRCYYLVSTGAPLAKETRLYMDSLNIPIMEVYGMSECTGPATLNIPGLGNYWGGSVGISMLGTQNKLGTTAEESSGELCLRGRHVFMGYIRKEKETNETIDKDGWLRTGDLSRLDMTLTGGPFVYITGRIKELIITAGGENVAPIPIEDAIKNELREFVSNAMVVGDYKKFLSVLLTIKTELDSSTNTPSDTLTRPAQAWLSSILGEGSNIKSVKQIIEQKPAKLHDVINLALKKVNDEAVSRASMVRKWTFILKDFSVVGGELGPTMKLRRPIVVKMYTKQIDSLYQEDDDEHRVIKARDSTKQHLSAEDTNGSVPLKHSESYITHI